MESTTTTHAISCRYIDTCFPDYIDDHYNRENEWLIHRSLPCNLERAQGLQASAAVFPMEGTDCDVIKSQLWISASYCEKIPAEISDEQIKEAISDMVDNLEASDYAALQTPNYDDADSDDIASIFAYLTW